MPMGDGGSVLTIDINQITLLAKKIGDVRPLSHFFASRLFTYKISEPNSPSLTRVRIFILGRTDVIVRMIFPRSFIVML